MNEFLKRIEDKIDVIQEKINSIDKTLISQALQLENHIQRTNILQEEVKRIQKLSNFFDSLWKISIAIGGFTSFFYTVLRIIKII